MVESRYAVVNVGKPTLKVALVLECSLNVELVVRLLVEIIAGNSAEHCHKTCNQIYEFVVFHFNTVFLEFEFKTCGN